MALQNSKPAKKTPLSCSDFIEYWDIVIEQWLQNRSGCHELEEQKQFALNLGIDEENRLPEPYWGDPGNNSFVIMSYNPGPCKDSRHNYRFCADSDNCMIHEVKSKKYSGFAKTFPLYRTLKTTESWFQDSIGRSWWLKHRKKWIEDLTKMLKCKNENPFAMEFCAWHSDNWKGIKSRSIDSSAPYINLLLESFVGAIESSDSHIGICFGCQFRNSKKFISQIINKGFAYDHNIGKHHIYKRRDLFIVLYCKGDRQRYPSDLSEIDYIIKRLII